jgi:hypothetical protein
MKSNLKLAGLSGWRLITAARYRRPRMLMMRLVMRQMWLVVMLLRIVVV